MGKIKSALEIALERTEGIQADKGKIKHQNDVDSARRIAGSYLTSDTPDKEKTKKELDGIDIAAVKEALAASVLSALSLPQDEVTDDRFDRVLFLASIASDNDPDVLSLVSQLSDFLKRFPLHRKDLIEKMKEQFRPIIEEKEEKLRQQYGQNIHLSVENDKEFLQAASQNLDRLQAQYDATLSATKRQLSELMDQGR